jgi:gamma-glutamyl-gamma-aminobutyraldehyde dehydrogenase
MHEPLTAAEYKAIAADLQLPTNAFVDGAFRPAKSGKTFQTTNPATGEVLAEIAACDARCRLCRRQGTGRLRRRSLASADSR